MTNKASILIIDDIVDNLKLLNEILTTNGFIVRPADNGKLAISSALAEKPDLILLDVRMPEMDGFEVCRQLKFNAATADIPVMFISAYDELTDRLKGFKLGAVDFITKPFEPREVIARINTQLELSHLRRESIRQASELKITNKLLLEKAEEIEAQNEELQVQNEEMSNAKRVIEESEEKFRLLYTAMNQGLALHEIITDKDGKPIDYVFLDINDSYTRILGVTREMSIGKRIREVMPDVEEYWIDTFGKVALTGEPCYYENFLKTTGLYYSTFTFSPKKNQFAVLVSDISERKKAEAAILASERKFRSYVENAPDSIIIINPQGYFLDVNNEAIRILGYSRSELLQMNISQIVDPDYQPKIHDAYNQLKISGRFESEIKVVSKNGNSIFCQLNEIKIDDEHYLGFMKDISDRKSLEIALEKRVVALTKPIDDNENIDFNDMFNPGILQRIQDEFSAATGVASIITALDGTPITKPSNFTRFCEKIIRPTEKGQQNCFHSDAVLGRYNSEGPIIQHCLSGGLWDAGASITVGNRHIANWLIGQVRDENMDVENIRSYARIIGSDEEETIKAYFDVPAMSFNRFEQIAKALYTLATQLSNAAYQNIQQARFITERKLAEEANQKLQEQLNQSQKMESVGRLAGGVAHDFNNMLSVILGQTQLALMDISDDNPLKHTLEQITVAAKRSADLTRQLLAFARKQIIVPKIININDTVEGILKLLKRLIGEDISLYWIPDSKPLHVKMDPTQVDQLLTNMLVNSRDAISGEGEITVSSSCASFSDDFCRFNPEVEAGEYVLLQISDNGCGMTKETRDNIFEPFYTTKEVGKGTGLGMATVYGIVKQNHGFISVYSEVGIGTTFKIYLPGYTVNATGEVTKGINEKAPTGTETILIVEDEVSVLEITKAMLESLGYRILPFSVPGEAVDFLKSYDGELDLVISDVIMPSMNGRDLANMFKTLRTDFKTLFMSGYTAENIDRHGMLDNGVCFLQKPFSRKELADKVREALK